MVQRYERIIENNAMMQKNAKKCGFTLFFMGSEERRAANSLRSEAHKNGLGGAQTASKCLSLGVTSVLCNENWPIFNTSKTALLELHSGLYGRNGGFRWSENAR